VLGRQHGGGLNGSSAADGASNARPYRPQRLLQRFGTLRQCAESVLVLGRSMAPASVSNERRQSAFTSRNACSSDGSLRQCGQCQLTFRCCRRRRRRCDLSPAAAPAPMLARCTPVVPCQLI